MLVKLSLLKVYKSVVELLVQEPLAESTLHLEVWLDQNGSIPGSFRTSGIRTLSFRSPLEVTHLLDLPFAE